MEAAGVDMDGSEHYIALRLRGQPSPVVIKLADGEKSRLWKELQGAEGFIEFEGTRPADDHRIDDDKIDDKAPSDDEKPIDDLEKPTKRRYLSPRRTSSRMALSLRKPTVRVGARNITASSSARPKVQTSNAIQKKARTKALP